MKKATKINLTLLVLTLSTNGLYAQQGFGTNQPSKAAVIDMQSESKGLLIPRVSLTSLTLFLPIKGETATNIDKTNSLLVYNIATVGATIKPGYYYWTTDGTTPNSSWKRLLANNDASALALAGDVTGTLGATIVGRIQGIPVTNTAPTTNQVLTYNGTAWTPTAITPATISGKADLSVTDGIRIATGSGTGALLNAATVGITDKGIAPIKISPGTNGQVLTTDVSGNSSWANKSSLITGVSNTSSVNSLTTTVNGTTGSAVSIINSNVLTLNASNQIVSTVNGQGSTALDLTPAIKANQQNTVVQGTGAISVPTAVVSGNNTTYTVGVATATNTGNLGVVKQAATNPSVNVSADGTLSVNTGATGIGKTLTGSGITVTAGSTVGTGTSLASTVLADVTLGIADNAITSTKIANNAVTVGKLPAGASATTFLRGDGTWITPTDTNTTYTGSTSITLNGASFERAALTGDVTAPANSNVTTIANNAVTAGKISDDAVTAAKINPDVAGNGLTQAADGALQVNAQNGINVNNDLVKLGGTLTENTTLTNSTFDLTLATTTAGTTGKLKVTGLDKTKIQATINTGTTTGITEHVLAVGADNVVKALKATMPKFFYMPSIIVPIANSQFTAINGSAGESFADGTRTGVLNLYERYKVQFGTVGTATQPSSPSAPALPVLPASELHYYVTWYDTTIFQSVTLDATGKMTYIVRTGVDVTVGSFMNIVFSVKEN